MARKNNHNLLECGFIHSSFGKYEYREPMFTIHVYIREHGWGAGVESADKTKWGEKEHETAEEAALAVIDFLMNTEYVPLCKSKFESLKALIEEKAKEVNHNSNELPAAQRHRLGVMDALAGYGKRTGGKNA